MLACNSVCKATSCALMCVCVFWDFNLRLSYVRVRCAAQVWSVLRFPAERGPLHTLTCLRAGGVGGGVQRQRTRGKEGIKERKRRRWRFCSSLTRNRNTFCMATLAGMLMLPPRSVLSHSFITLIHFSHFSLFPPLSFHSPFCPLQIMGRVGALTPVLFEIVEEITALICAYFALFWIAHPEMIFFSPHFA